METAQPSWIRKVTQVQPLLRPGMCSEGCRRAAGRFSESIMVNLVCGDVGSNEEALFHSVGGLGLGGRWRRHCDMTELVGTCDNPRVQLPDVDGSRTMFSVSDRIA